MARVNITFNGRSADIPFDLDFSASDTELKRTAAELISSGELPALYNRDFRPHWLNDYVVDRFRSRTGGDRIYIRPKVPFGALS